MLYKFNYGAFIVLVIIFLLVDPLSHSSGFLHFQDNFKAIIGQPNPPHVSPVWSRTGMKIKEPYRHGLRRMFLVSGQLETSSGSE